METFWETQISYPEKLSNEDPEVARELSETSVDCHSSLDAVRERKTFFYVFQREKLENTTSFI